MKEETSGLWAFWDYDSFPYLLGGEVGELNGNKVNPRKYGGYWFKVAFFLPKTRGEELKKELKNLEDEKRSRENELNIEFRERLEKILSTYPGAKVKY